MIRYEAQPTSLLHTNSFQTFYPSVLGYLKVEVPVNLQRFTEAVEKMSKVFPQIFCRYELSDNYFYPVTETAATIIHQLDSEESPFTFPLDFLKKPQLEIFLRTKKDFQEIFFLESHIVADGAGLKLVMACILAFYNNPDTSFGKNHQDLNEVVAHVPKDFLNEAKRQDTTGITLDLPFPETSESAFYAVQHVALDELQFAHLHEATKKNNLTLNDVMLTSFMRILAKYNPEAAKIPLACPTDTRQFLPKSLKHELHIGNFTARYNPQPEISYKESFLASGKKVHDEMKFLKDHYQFLQSTLTIIENYQTQTLLQLREDAKKNYHMRSISYTNMSQLSSQQFSLKENTILEAYTSGAFRKTPMFQVCFSSFSGRLNLVANVIGDDKQQQFAKELLQEIKNELLTL
ncbi:hypothetical protein [Enterococcus timonensis]|uniref:hypothetical protein n=1 Tax=Enterococcus timonensis TaxID=1852364 RepID=UPI0008DAB3E3|nr:hypothetical protein [Enterococcus timonensis]